MVDKNLEHVEYLGRKEVSKTSRNGCAFRVFRGDSGDVRSEPREEHLSDFSGRIRHPREEKPNPRGEERTAFLRCASEPMPSRTDDALGDANGVFGGPSDRASKRPPPWNGVVPNPWFLLQGMRSGRARVRYHRV